MKKISILVRLIGIIQIVLGILYLVAPGFILRSMGHSVPEADLYYPLAMLAGRFISYGIALIYISSDPMQHKLWIYFMILIQVIDLAAGIFYTSTGVVELSLSAFPMFNASWMVVLLLLWSPKETANEKLV